MKRKMVLLSLLSILIVAVSWLTNFGFLRLFCTTMLIPFAHAIIVFAICVVASNYSFSKKVRLYNMLFDLTYVLSNVFFPDADELSGRIFFGLIENGFMCSLGEVLSIVALIIHIILLVVQIVEINRIDRNGKDFVS